MAFTEKLKVFISYSSADKESAETVCNYLEKNGMTCWIAPRDIAAGAEYGAEIINGIETSDVMAVIFSKSANDSQHVLREVERGVNRKMPLVVFKIEECTLSKSMEYFLLSNQWLDASGGIEDTLPLLSSSIDKMYGKSSSVNRQEVIVSPGSTIHVMSRTVTVLLAVIAAGIICVAGALILSSIKGSSSAENALTAAAEVTTEQAQTTAATTVTETEETAVTSDDIIYETEEAYVPLETYAPAYSLSETILTTDPTGTYEVNGRNIVCYNSGETAYVDIDGDGVEDTISFNNEEDTILPKLFVNDSEMDTVMKAAPYFWVCDINLADGMKEVAVGAGWYSNHYTTYFYRYYDGALIYIGSVEDMIDDNIDIGNEAPLGSRTTISGDGSIETPKKLNIFQSWSSYTIYVMSEQTGTIEERQDMYYPYGIVDSSSYDAVAKRLDDGGITIPTLNREINIYVEKDTASGAIRLSPQRVIATATDDRAWVYVVAEDGTRGWLYMQSNTTALDPLVGTQYECNEIFDNLPAYN